MYRAFDDEQEPYGLNKKALLEQMGGIQSAIEPSQDADPGFPMPTTGNPTGPYNPDPIDAPKPPAIDKSKWDDDGYGKPNYTASDFGDTPLGFEAGNWTNANMQTPKYVIGRLVAEAGRQAGGINAPDFERIFGENLQKAYGGAFKYGGKDRVIGPDGKRIDAITNYGAENAAPGWIVFDEDGEGQGGGMGGMGGGGPMLSGGSMLAAQLQGDPMARINEALAKLQGQAPNLDALLAQFGG